MPRIPRPLPTSNGADSTLILAAAPTYETLKALAAEYRQPLYSLLALSDDVDPFIAGRPGRRLEGAQWFAAMWEELEVPDGVHLRRLHYLLVSTPGIVLAKHRREP
jgi:hypothetical protein